MNNKEKEQLASVVESLMAKGESFEFALFSATSYQVLEIIDEKVPSTPLEIKAFILSLVAENMEDEDFCGKLGRSTIAALKRLYGESNEF